MIDKQLLLDSIYSVLPVDFNSLKKKYRRSTQERALIVWDYLNENCIGKSKAQPSETIAIKLAETHPDFLVGRDRKDWGVHIASLTRVLIELGHPVCSLTGGKEEHRGSYIPETEEEVVESALYLRALAYGLLRRAAKLIESMS